MVFHKGLGRFKKLFSLLVWGRLEINFEGKKKDEVALNKLFLKLGGWEGKKDLKRA